MSQAAYIIDLDEHGLGSPGIGTMTCHACRSNKVRYSAVVHRPVPVPLYAHWHKAGRLDTVVLHNHTSDGRTLVTRGHPQWQQRDPATEGWNLSLTDVQQHWTAIRRFAWWKLWRWPWYAWKRFTAALLNWWGLVMAAKPTVVCLCGSTRFYDAFQHANYELTMAGRIVLSVGFYPHSATQAHGEDVGCTAAQKQTLDELHLRKIDLADEVLVLNVGGYVGESTCREIEYAVKQGKPIYYLETAPDGDAVLER